MKNEKNTECKCNCKCEMTKEEMKSELQKQVEDYAKKNNADYVKVKTSVTTDGKTSTQEAEYGKKPKLFIDDDNMDLLENIGCTIPFKTMFDDFSNAFDVRFSNALRNFHQDNFPALDFFYDDFFSNRNFKKKNEELEEKKSNLCSTTNETLAQSIKKREEEKKREEDEARKHKDAELIKKVRNGIKSMIEKTVVSDKNYKYHGDYISSSIHGIGELANKCFNDTEYSTLNLNNLKKHIDVALTEFALSNGFKKSEITNTGLKDSSIDFVNFNLYF